MREPYQPPKIVSLGSVAELTQANLLGPAPDNLSLVSLNDLGIDITVPGGVFS